MNKKICILGDLHFGIKSNNNIVEKTTCDWLENVFFKYVSDNNIKYIVQLGDIFHNRKAITTESATNVVKYYINKIPKSAGLIQIIGNHDSVLNDSTKLNSPYLLMHNNIQIKLIENYSYIEEIDADCFSWGAFNSEIPSKGKYCFGHFDIVGAQMNNGITCSHGYNLSAFDVYDKVFSGHYHNRSQYANVTYVGTPIAQNFGEIDTNHSFTVLDLETGKHICVDTNIKIFEKITYLEPINPKNKVIKVLVDSSIDSTELNKYVLDLYSQGAIDVKLIETGTESVNENSDNKDYEILPTIDLLIDYVDNSSLYSDKDKNLLKQLLIKINSKVESNI